jgi:glycogen synthase
VWQIVSCSNVYFKQFQVHYTSENVVEGKSAAKKALQQKLGLQENDVPIVGIVTRLTAQKGIHLIKHAVHRTLEWNGQVPPLQHS